MQIDPKILSTEERGGCLLRSLYRRFGYSQYKMSRFEEYALYIRNKDFLASEGIISFTDTNLEKAFMRLVKQMVKRDSQFVTVIYGEDVTDEQSAALEEQIQAKYGSKTEITVINGGQPVYYYILSVE